MQAAANNDNATMYLVIQRKGYLRERDTNCPKEALVCPKVG